MQNESINRFLRGVIYVGMFIVPFIPLYVSSFMFFPFITGKNFAFRIIVEIIASAWLILMIRDASYRPRFSWIYVSVMAFLGVITLADITGVNFTKSFYSNFERMEGLLAILHLVLYFLVAGSVFKTNKLWARFLHTSLFVSVILAIYSMLQLAGKIVINQGGVRIDATLGNATYLAIYAMFHFFIATFFFLRAQGKVWLKLIYVIIAGLNVFMIYYAGTRGVGLGLVGGTLITTILIALFERDKKILRKWAVASLALIIIFVGVFMVIRKSDFVKTNSVLSRFANITISEGSSRFMVWNMAYKGFKERPILGWGQGNFDVVFNKYYDPNMYSQEQWFDRAHNVVFDWLIAGGILGLFAYFSLLVASLLSLWKADNSVFSISDKAILTGLLAGYAFQNLFVFDNITSYFLFFSFLAFIHANTSVSFKGAIWQKIIGANGVADRILIPSAIVLMVLTVYQFNVKPILASRSLIEGIRFTDANVGKNLAKFKESIEYNTIGKSEAREQLMQSALRIRQTEAINNEFKTRFTDYAREQMEQQVIETPNNARYRFFLGSYMRRIGKSNEALEILLETRKYSPNKQQIEFEIASLYEELGNSDKAIEALKNTYESAPAYETALTRYAVALIVYGKSDIASKILTDKFGNDYPRNDDIIRAYSIAGRNDKVVEIWLSQVKKEPNNLQSNLSLAAAYMLVGDTSKAIKQVELVIELDPNYRETGEKIIADIKAGKNPVAR